MKAIKSIKEEPFKSIIEEEWKRSKEIFPLLSVNYKPRFKWSNFKGNRDACCWKRGNRDFQIEFTIKYLKNLGKYSIEIFRKTLRHEIAHILQQNHSKQFKKIVDKLEGCQYRAIKWMTLEITNEGKRLDISNK